MYDSSMYPRNVHTRAFEVCTFGPCIHTYIHTYIHTSSCLGMYVSPDIHTYQTFLSFSRYVCFPGHTYIHTGYALKVCTFGPCIHTYIHTSSCLGMYVSPNIHTYHTYLSFSRYVCSPETYIPLILRYVPLDHTYIRTYIPRWGGGRGCLLDTY